LLVKQNEGAEQAVIQAEKHLFHAKGDRLFFPPFFKPQWK
jgi:hypothetical protein